MTAEEERKAAVTEAQRAFKHVCDLHLLQEGDVVILRAPSSWTVGQCQDMADYVRLMNENRVLGIKFLMMPEDIAISVLRRGAVRPAG